MSFEAYYTPCAMIGYYDAEDVSTLPCTYPLEGSVPVVIKSTSNCMLNGMPAVQLHESTLPCANPLEGSVPAAFKSISNYMLNGMPDGQLHESTLPCTYPLEGSVPAAFASMLDYMTDAKYEIPRGCTEIYASGDHLRSKSPFNLSGSARPRASSENSFDSVQDLCGHYADLPLDDATRNGDKLHYWTPNRGDNDQASHARQGSCANQLTRNDYSPAATGGGPFTWRSVDVPYGEHYADLPINVATRNGDKLHYWTPDRGDNDQAISPARQVSYSKQQPPRSDDSPATIGGGPFMWRYADVPYGGHYADLPLDGATTHGEKLHYWTPYRGDNDQASPARQGSCAKQLTRSDDSPAATASFTCHHCGRFFKQHSHLRNHLRVHSGEANFACEVCPQRFRLKSELRRHMLLHSVENPQICPLCGRLFGKRRHLSRHLKTHEATADNRRTLFDCDVCGKQFGSKAHLAEHRMAHPVAKLQGGKEDQQRERLFGESFHPRGNETPTVKFMDLLQLCPSVKESTAAISFSSTEHRIAHPVAKLQEEENQQWGRSSGESFYPGGNETPTVKSMDLIQLCPNMKESAATISFSSTNPQMAHPVAKLQEEEDQQRERLLAESLYPHSNEISTVKSVDLKQRCTNMKDGIAFISFSSTATDHQKVQSVAKLQGEEVQQRERLLGESFYPRGNEIPTVKSTGLLQLRPSTKDSAASASFSSTDGIFQQTRPPSCIEYNSPSILDSESAVHVMSTPSGFEMASPLDVHTTTYVVHTTESHDIGVWYPSLLCPEQLEEANQAMHYEHKEYTLTAL